MIGDIFRDGDMTIDDFIGMTQRIIAQDGFEDFLPTLVLPDSQQVAVLEGVPVTVTVNVETAARNWADRKAGAGEDYFLACKSDPAHFKVVARVKGRAIARHWGIW